MAKKLNEVITSILQTRPEGLTTRQITDIIHQQNLWHRPIDGQLPQVSQVSARINNYDDDFIKKNGLVYLKKPGNEERIARVAFNTNNWEYPSGPEGKSRSAESFEAKNGYTHEEWLLDFSKLIGGYKYGFLQPINANLQAYQKSVFNILLFTHNSRTKENSWVARINNCEVIDAKTSRQVKKRYRQKGWYRQMRKDISQLGFDPNTLDKWRGEHLFNVRFRPQDVEQFPPGTLVIPGDPSISTGHYVLLHIKETPVIVKRGDHSFELGRCRPGRRFSGKKIKRKATKLIEYPYVHDEISMGLEKYLRKKYDDVYPEHDTGFTTSIDMVAVKKGVVDFFEIKTYSDVRTCIRTAIGQLAEYCYFPDKQLARCLYIVTPHRITDQNLVTYFEHLVNTVGLPIRYLQYDLENKTVGQII